MLTLVIAMAVPLFAVIGYALLNSDPPAAKRGECVLEPGDAGGTDARPTAPQSPAGA